MEVGKCNIEGITGFLDAEAYLELRYVISLKLVGIIESTFNSRAYIGMCYNWHPSSYFQHPPKNPKIPIIHFLINVVECDFHIFLDK